MSKIKERRWHQTVCILLAVVLLGALGGCGVENNENKAHEPLTLCNVNDTITPYFLEELHKVHPEIVLDMSYYRGANGSGYTMHTLEQGDIPDVYIATQLFHPEKQKEYLMDLSGYDFINNYTTTLLNEIDNDGGIYLIPCSYQLVGITYNKTIMDENGWEVPQSLEELEALAPEIKAAGYDVMRALFTLDGYPFNYFFNLGNTQYFSTADGTRWKNDFVQGKAKASGNEELLKTVEYFQRWFENGLLTVSDIDAGNEPEKAFYNGECIFYLSLGIKNYTHTTEDGKTYEFGVIPWLSEDGNNNMLTQSLTQYFGINKELLEKGNEQKLEDALNLLRFLSSSEGQAALVAETANSWLYTSPLVGSAVSEKSPFYPMNDLVISGNTVPLVYVNWEALIAPMAKDIKMLIKGEITPEQLLEEFDKSYVDVMSGGGEEVLAVAKEDMTLEDTVRLCGIAVGKAVDADATLTSLGGFYVGDKTNRYGVPWYFYAGNVTSEVVNIFRTRCDTTSVIEMTGAEIKAMAEAGFDLHGNGQPFTYVLTTRGDMELDDEAVYRLAVGTEELTAEWKEKATVVEVSSKQAIIDYVSTLGAFGPEDIIWN